MSDFLARMVERVMGKGPTVKPIISPMFTPGPLMAGNSPVEPDAASSDQEPASISTESKPILITNQQATIRSASPATRITSSENMAERIEQDSTSFFEPVINSPQRAAIKPATRAARPIQEGNLSPAASEPRVAGIGKKREKAYSRKVTPAGSDRSGAISTIVPEPPESGITPQSHNGHDPFTIASHLIQRRRPRFGNDLMMEEQRFSADVTGHRLRAEDFEISGKIASSISSPDAIRPRVVIRSEPPLKEISGENNTTPDVASLAPTIKVSIGRIEVRAITQQTAPEKHYAPPAPKVSLDEYLKKQSEGKR